MSPMALEYLPTFTIELSHRCRFKYSIQTWSRWKISVDNTDIPVTVKLAQTKLQLGLFKPRYPPVVTQHLMAGQPVDSPNVPPFRNKGLIRPY